MLGAFRLPALIAGWVFMALATGSHAAAPTGVTLTPAVARENWPPGAVVGTFSAVDADVGDSHSFSFVEGIGGLDNGGFYIAGNQLIVLYGVTLDFDAEPRDLQIRVMATDSTSQSFERAIAITVIDDRSEDADRDGLSEMDEEDIHGTSDSDFDTDGDGVGDGVELTATPPTSPLAAGEWPHTAILGWGNSTKRELSAPLRGGILTMATGQYHSLAICCGGGVAAWGSLNTYGQTTVPAGMGEVIEVAAGGDFWLDDSGHSLALKRDGTLVAWGFDDDGGNRVPAGLDQVKAIAAGRAHSLAVKADGSVVAWGSNPHGGITPPPGLGNVVAVSARGYFSLALKSDGTVAAWGSNFDGIQWVDATSPVGLRDVVAISAGRFHSLALKHDGSVVAWGYNSHGQTNVPSGLTGVVAIAAGGFHSMALKNDGSVVAWGANSHGQATVPISARSGVKLISAGILHSMAAIQQEPYPAITSSSRILSSPGAWVSHQVAVTHALALGFSAVGLPPGLSIDPVSGLISGSAAASRSSVRIQVETDQGRLAQSAWIGISAGLPPTALGLSPAVVSENSNAGTVVGSLTATDPDAGDAHVFEWVDGAGSTDNRMFRIEGNQVVVNQKITLDYEKNPADLSIRVRARDASLNPYEQIVTIRLIDDRSEDADGDGLSEAQEEDIYLTSDTKRDTDGDGFSDGFEVVRGFAPGNAASFPTGRILLGWGSDPDGRANPPLGVPDVIDLAAGFVHSLALKSDGKVLAWGGNGDGQATVPGSLTGVTAVAAGKTHSLALKSGGTVSAWGNNAFGQINVPSGLRDVVAIAAGDFHNLALRQDGGVVAWGDDWAGQCAVPAGLTGVVALAAGSAHSMALKSDGTVVAWGGGADGVSSVPVGLSGVIAIAAGGFHCLALRHDGTVQAWGSNFYGQASVPAGIGKVTEIVAGRLHSMALKTDGSLAAWGDGTYGQTKIPMEALQVRKLAAGGFHNLAVRQGTGFPAFAEVSEVRGWPGEGLTKWVLLQNALATGFSAMGLPSGLSIAPASGLVSGTITSGERRASRISAVTDQGTLSRVIWYNTVDGIAPTAIALSSNSLPENSPAGTLIGTLSATDPNAGDSHGFSLVEGTGMPESDRFHIFGDQLLVSEKLTVDFEAGITRFTIRVAALDSGNNSFERDFTLIFTDDRTEDADQDGVREAIEEDVFGTSDAVFDDFRISDTDRDGTAGMIEYAFNLDPKTAGPPVRLAPAAGGTAGLPAIGLVADGPGRQRLRIEFLRRVGAGLIYTPQFSGNMQVSSWQAATQPVTVTPINGGWERCVVLDSQSTSAATQRFGRVSVSW